MSDLKTRATELAERLTMASGGTEEWRVQDPVSGSFCMVYSRRDAINPERCAKQWLAEHQAQNGRYSHFVVVKCNAQSRDDKLMAEGAALLTEVAAELERLNAAPPPLHPQIVASFQDHQHQILLRACNDLLAANETIKVLRERLALHETEPTGGPTPT